MEQKPNLLGSVLHDFRQENLRLPTVDIQPGDGEKPLAYIAAKVFRGDFELYQEWLCAKHRSLGSMTPLELLAEDSESWTVRNALMMLWLRENRLIVPLPHKDPIYEMIVSKYGKWDYRRASGTA